MATLLFVCLISLFFSQAQTIGKYIVFIQDNLKARCLLVNCEIHIFFSFQSHVYVTYLFFWKQSAYKTSNSISQKPQFFLNNKNIRISWNFFISFHLHFFLFFFQWRIYWDLYKFKKLIWCQSKHSLIIRKSECRFVLVFFISNCHEQGSTCLTFTHILFFTSKQIFRFWENFLLLYFFGASKFVFKTAW